MTRRLLIATVAILVFLGAAWLVWSKLFVDETPAPTSDQAVVLAPDAMEEPKLEVTAVLMTSIEGLVEVEKSDGEWKVLAIGDEVSLGDRLRTGDGAKAIIDIAGTKVEIGENGTLEIPQLRRVDIGDGQITATVEEADEAFVVGAKGSDATAEANAGEFAVISDGKGRVVVASKSGKALFKKAGKTVEVPEGSISVATKNSGPSAPQKIPSSLFLKVNAPRSVLKTKRFTLQGASSPGTIIRINGESVKVGDDGTFQHIVALKVGKNAVIVDGRDVLGRSTTKKVNVKVDSTGPTIDGKVTW